MEICKKIVRFATIVSTFLLINSNGWAGEQVLAEVGAAGVLPDDTQGVVTPNFSVNQEYAPWVAASGRNIIAMAISLEGTVLLLEETTYDGTDSTWLIEYDTAGQIIESAAYPFDVLNADFPVTKKNGNPGTDSFNSVGAFTVLNNGTVRIAGEFQGSGFVIGAYDPFDQSLSVPATGTPPSISDIVGDEFGDAVSRRDAGYWAVGEKRKVIFFPLPTEEDPDRSESDWTVVSTFSGKNAIDSSTPFLDNQVIVAFDNGDLVSINATTGAVNETFANLPTDNACAPGRKDSTRYSVRGDPNGTLFVGDMYCQEITIFDDMLDPVDDTVMDELADNPFELPDFSITSLDWISGAGGDFNVECNDEGGLGVQDPGVGCQAGQKEGQLVMWDVDVDESSESSYRGFQYENVEDCRWTGTLPCPVLNPECPDPNTACGLDPQDMVLDIAPLLLALDTSGTWEALLSDGPQTMAIPKYVRGERCVPLTDSDYVDPTENCPNGFYFNNYRFFVFAIETEARWPSGEVFYNDIDVDELWDFSEFNLTSDDQCMIPGPNSSIEDIAETLGVFLWNSSDAFGTVNRNKFGTNPAEGTRGGVFTNSFCNGGRTGARWSALSAGLEFYDLEAAPNPLLYNQQAERMMDELVQVADEYVCNQFDNPQTPAADLIGPLVTDCSSIYVELNQMDQKLDTCLESTYADTNGGNASPNCSAFFTKVVNAKEAVAISPKAELDPFDPALTGNYVGEILMRLDAIDFFVSNYVIPAVPASGHLRPAE